METSKWPKRLSKQGYDVAGPQYYRIRCSDPKSYLEDEDSFEERIRHTHSKQATRSFTRERAQSRSMGTDAWVSQD